MTTDLQRESLEAQTHCYTCGKRFDRVKYKCPICDEFQCSEECRAKHIKTLNET